MKTRMTLPSIFTVLLSSAALAVVAVGCGGSDDADGGSGGNYTLDDVCEKLAAKECAMAKPCCESTGIGYDDAGCIAHARSQCEEAVSLVKEGKRVFHPEAVDACLSVLSTNFERCDLTTEELVDFGVTSIVCQRVFAGTVEPGGECSERDDCKPPTGQDEFAICNGGKCDVGHVNVQEGGDCGPSDTCAAGLYCKVSDDGVVTTTPTGKCRQPKAVGEDCSSPALLGGNCGPGRYCNLESNTCQPLKEAGEDCLTSLECKSAECDGTCGEEMTWPMADEAICSGEGDEP